MGCQLELQGFSALKLLTGLDSNHKLPKMKILNGKIKKPLTETELELYVEHLWDDQTDLKDVDDRAGFDQVYIDDSIILNEYQKARKNYKK